MYRGALRSVFSELLRQERVIVADELGVFGARRRRSSSRSSTRSASRGGCIVVKGFDANLWLAARNLPHVAVEEARFVDPVALVGAEKGARVGRGDEDDRGAAEMSNAAHQEPD
jgi:large subunit ribosomal protein L4